MRLGLPPRDGHGPETKHNAERGDTTANGGDATHKGDDLFLSANGAAQSVARDGCLANCHPPIQYSGSMTDESALRGCRVAIAGAGLAGLTAAYRAEAQGAEVVVFEPRTRVGGRVWTRRDGFQFGQFAEAGADLIDEAHTALRDLARELEVPLTPILRDGFGYARRGDTGTVTLHSSSPDAATGWAHLADRLAPILHAYRSAGGDWNAPALQSLGEVSVATWAAAFRGDDDLHATLAGLRSFFLADPDQLSLLPVLDLFASLDEDWGGTYRAVPGNSAIPEALAARLHRHVQFDTAVTAIRQDGDGVRLTLRGSDRLQEWRGDAAILAVPAAVLPEVAFFPTLPLPQARALATLATGRATKTLLQTATRFWRAPNRPLALGTPFDIGALWDANEQQAGAAGILSLLAGGSASLTTDERTDGQGLDGVLSALGWLGSTNASIIGGHQTRWHQDPWARGGYAAFTTAFRPDDRAWLGRRHGRIVFAGEYASRAWQGYMNGAVESGAAAAALLGALWPRGGLERAATPTEP
mgnify:CR=1 FL=1